MKNIFIVLVCIYHSISLIGQSNLTLDQAIKIGLENNYGLKTAFKEIALAETENSWARAGKTPRVNANGSLNNNLLENNNPASFINGTIFQSNISADISGQMTLYNGGRIKNTKEQLELNETRSVKTKNIQIIETRRAITSAYYSTLATKENIVVLENLINLSRDRYEYGLARKEFGQTRGFEIRQLEESIFSDSISLIQQRIAYKNGLIALKQAMNIAGEFQYMLTDDLPLDFPKYLKAEVIKEVKKNNLNIQQLALAIESSKINTEIQKSAMRPSVNMSAGVSAQENFNKFFEINPNTNMEFEGRFGSVFNGSVGVSATYPLYDGGINKSNVAIAKIREEISFNNYEQVMWQLEIQVENLLSNFESNIAILDVIDSRYANAERNLAEAEERFKLGQLSSFDYRATQLQLLNTAQTKLNTLLNIALIEVELEALMGR